MQGKYTSVTAHSGTHSISKNIPLSEVNRHCVPEDCWVALNGKARLRGASEDLKVIEQSYDSYDSYDKPLPWSMRPYFRLISSSVGIVLNNFVQEGIQ